jgi:glyoxylase-like metal-dependent hydrolase (beta-lactamase superfamily II)/rhodanese-related sulfurtransferase
MTTEDLQIDAGTLANWLTEKKQVTILDVRPKAEREEWAIQGSIHMDVYDMLKANDPTVFANIDVDKMVPVVTVCAGGKTSLKAADILKQKGYDVYSLEGGMKAWNFAFNTAEVVLNGAKIIQVRRSSKGVLSYIIGSGNEAMVIDAALDPKVYQGIVKANGWTIKYVTDTHVHADFISRTKELSQVSGAIHILIDKTDVNYPFTPISDGDCLSVGSIVIEVIHTPGHTIESTSFKLGDEAVFTGDTLFTDGVGRPDLKANQDEAVKRSKLLFKSVQQLMTLNAKMLVFPAHLATAVPFDSKIVGETINNLRTKLTMLQLSEADFVQYTTSRIPTTPPNYQTIASLNKQGSYAGYVPSELEAGANRCAIA